MGKDVRGPGGRVARSRAPRKVRAPRKRRCRVTPGGGDPRESATESRPPMPHGAGKGERVRQERTARPARSEEHTSELQSLMRISYAVFCLKKKKTSR